MGHDDHRGREYHLRNIVYHKLSYFELSVWKSVVASLKTIPRRVNNSVPYWLPIFAANYLLLEWANEQNELFHRKNPKDFENDV